MDFWHWPGVGTCGENNLKLKINEACLQVFSYANSTIKLKSQTPECFGCVFIDQGTIEPNANNYFVIDTSYPLTLQIEENGLQTQITKRFDDFGLYSLQYHEKRGLLVQVTKEPEYFWMNFAIIISLCLVLAAVVKAMQYVKKRQWCLRLINRNVPFQELEAESTGMRRNEARTRRLGRVATIDVFRGIAITLMIFVNYGGGHYAFFKHAPWNGLTIADVVFPFFIWIMGVSSVISLRSHLRASLNRCKIFKKAVIRSIFLICLGLVLNSGKRSDVGIRLPGVLQRIGLTYLILASVEIFLSRPQRNELFGPWNRCVELADAVFQWAVVIIFAALHVTITFLLPVPGCPTGYLGPGGLSNNSDFPNCTGGAAGYIDRVVLSPNHIYQRPTSQKIYDSAVPYDPEGILGLLTSVVMAFLGALCGRIILSYEQSRSRIIRWLLWSILLGVIAGGLCSFSQNEGLIPINKNLWSLSFVLGTSSIAFLVFTIVYWLVDVSFYWTGKPFVFAGMNSMAMYLGHEILKRELPWRWTPITETHFELLAMDVSATIIWIFISYLMYIYNVFISL